MDAGKLKAITIKAVQNHWRGLFAAGAAGVVILVSYLYSIAPDVVMILAIGGAIVTILLSAAVFVLLWRRGFFRR